MFVEHGLAEASGDGVDELIAPQDAGNVAIIEDVFGSGQAQGRAGDHDRNFGGGLLLALVDLLPALENLGEEATEFRIAITI